MNKIVSKMIFGAALLVLASCTQDDEPGGNILPEGKYPLQINGITLGAEVSEQPWSADAPQTRVSESKDRNSSVWQDGDRIRIGIKGYADNDSRIYEIQVSDNKEITVSPSTDGPIYWKDKQTSKVRARYPADGNVDLSKQTKSNGLAYALYAETENDVDYNMTDINLPFKHKLAKVRVVLEGNKKDDVTEVKIKTCTTCTLHADGGLTKGNTKDFILMVETSYDNGTKCWEANVMPEEAITEFQVNGINGTLEGKGITPLEAKVNTITLTVRETSLQPGEDGQFTINKGDDVTIKDYEGNAPIVVNGNATITLSNVKLNTNDNVMTINNRATVTLNIEGMNNEFTSTQGAGIKIMESINTSPGGSITINGTGASSSKLKVTAASGAAIGFRLYGGTWLDIYGGDIEIKNITLEAKGGSGSPAIGLSVLENNGYDSPKTYGNISIDASTLIVSSTDGAACIGTPSHNNSSPFSLGNISITNSTVTAVAGGNQATCIGFGYTAGGWFNKVIQKIEFTNTTLNLTTGADNKVGFGAGDDYRKLTNGIWNDGSKVGDTGWNP